MPRPMMPAPMTATVLISAIGLGVLQGVHHLDVVGIGLAHVIGQALLFVVRHAGNARLDAAEGGGNVVNVIHHTDQFTSHWHAQSCSLVPIFYFQVSLRISKAGADNSSRMAAITAWGCSRELEWPAPGTRTSLALGMAAASFSWLAG